MALFVDGVRNSRVFVNSLFRAPGNKTLPRKSVYLEARHSTLSSYFSAVGVDATARHDCHTGTILEACEAFAHNEGRLRAVEPSLRGTERRDIVCMSTCLAAGTSGDLVSRGAVWGRIHWSSVRSASAHHRGHAPTLDATARATVGLVRRLARSSLAVRTCHRAFEMGMFAPSHRPVYNINQPS